ncbi:hypothetical protein ES703_60683 [subsurface metagenome]
MVTSNKLKWISFTEMEIVDVKRHGGRTAKDFASTPQILVLMRAPSRGECRRRACQRNANL